MLARTVVLLASAQPVQWTECDGGCPGGQTAHRASQSGSQWLDPKGLRARARLRSGDPRDSTAAIHNGHGGGTGLAAKWSSEGALFALGAPMGLLQVVEWHGFNMVIGGGIVESGAHLELSPVATWHGSQWPSEGTLLELGAAWSSPRSQMAWLHSKVARAGGHC